MRKMFALALVFLFVLVGAQAALAAKVTWRLVTHAMPGTEQQKLAEDFCETVKTLSGGEFVIEPYAAGVLFPVFESFDAVANGIVDAAMVYSAYWTGKDPAFILTTRPGCPISTFAEGVYLDEKLFPFFEKIYGKYGIKYLGHIMESVMPEQLMSVVPLKSIEDIKGKKIRSSGFGAKFYKELGASTVSLSAPEIYTAFQTKNIHAAEWTYWDENMRMGFQEVATFVLDPAYHTGVNENFPLVVNPARWDALPQNFKDILLVARDKARFQASLIYVAEIKAREKWKSNPNIEVASWSAEDAKKAREVGTKLLLAECEAIPEGKEYLEVYRNVLWELGYKDEAKNLGYAE
ncbi:TRAP transporter substrate-binding protein DctP [Aminiphilus sp.]|uniref:TRAP transporter substrate-binding protein DctP n=1 Tax=Aminiphilus sp. TaxID=1872488 RepID=UPI00262E5F67|nr:TRAP transporter substrate-binding protein DctP [Aminiphilus sp.]